MGLQKELLHKLAPVSMRSKDMTLNADTMKSGSSVKQNSISLSPYDQLERTDTDVSPDNNNHHHEQQSQPQRRVTLFGIPFLATHRNGSLNRARIPNETIAAADATASTPLTDPPGNTQV